MMQTLAPLAARLEWGPDDMETTTDTGMHVRCGRRQSWRSVDIASPKASEESVGRVKPS